MIPHRGPSRTRTRPAPSHQKRTAPSGAAEAARSELMGDCSPPLRLASMAASACSLLSPTTPSWIPPTECSVSICSSSRPPCRREQWTGSPSRTMGLPSRAVLRSAPVRLSYATTDAGHEPCAGADHTGNSSVVPSQGIGTSGVPSVACGRAANERRVQASESAARLDPVKHTMSWTTETGRDSRLAPVLGPAAGAVPPVAPLGPVAGSAPAAAAQAGPTEGSLKAGGVSAKAGLRAERAAGPDGRPPTGGQMGSVSTSSGLDAGDRACLRHAESLPVTRTEVLCAMA
mmetsp:Transcript_10118/g.33404  ORF Transcript_10118/g.33404 Transcript_10118/m.33404 type:complete len:288 (+) Transcript_10118:544-1407(+)